MDRHDTTILKYLAMLFRFVFVFATVIVCVIFLYYVAKYAYPFIIAFIFSFLINPLVNGLQEKTKLPRGFAVFLVILVIFSIILGGTLLVIKEMIEGLTDLSLIVPAHAKTLINFVENFFLTHVLPLWKQLTELMQSLDSSGQAAIQDHIDQIGSYIIDQISKIGTVIVTTMTNIVLSIPSKISVLFFIVLATFFICKDWFKITNFIKDKVDERVIVSGRNIYNGLKKAFFGYLRAQLTLVFITGVVVWIGLLFLRVHHATTIAFLTGFADLLPFIGTGIVFIPWILYLLVIHQFPLAIGLSILYAFIVVQRQMIEPKILSTSIGLNPLLTLISVFVGFKLFGVMGVITGPAILVLLNTLIQTHVFRDLWHYIIGKTPG